MIACVDVHYHPQHTVAAAVLARRWDDSESYRDVVAIVNTPVEDYQPGQFYLRELPCLLKLYAEIDEVVDVIVVDSYVWLDDQQRPGLGGHLYNALQQKAKVVGVAKTKFEGAVAEEVYRGSGARPLYVTAAGMKCGEAASHVQGMHGPYRIPTLLKRADQLCRSG